MKTPEYALEAAIAVWVKDNQDLVKCAIRLGAETTSLGLVDDEANSFMQIVPTEIFGKDGNLVHECFLNINHPAWGYYRIIIENESKFKVIEPKMIKNSRSPTILFSELEVIEYVKNLASVLDAHYAMNDAGEDKDFEKVEQILNDMLKKYHEDTELPLLEIKNIIDTYKGEIGIKATNDDEVVQPVSTVNTRYDLALLHPENWVVTNSDGINGQSWLSSWLKNFQIRENKSASLLYYAQKIAVEYLGLRLLVHTDSVEPETDLTAEVLRDEAMNLALVRPVIHATKFEIIR